jgi:hypothetical protein
MTIELHALRSLRCREETSFGVDMTSGGTVFTSFLYVPALEGTVNLTLNRAMEPVDTVQQYVDQIAEDIPGLLGWQLTFSVPFHATGVTAGSAQSSVTCAMGSLDKVIMGGESLSLGSNVVASPTPTTSSFSVSPGGGSRFVAGTAVAFQTATGGTYEIREVDARSTDAITLKNVLTQAPTTGMSAARSATYYLTEPATDPDTMQFVVEGVELDDRFVLCGGSGSFSIAIEYGKVPTKQYTFRGPYWLDYQGSAITSASYSNFNPVIVSGASMEVTTVGSTVDGLINPCFAVAFTPNISQIPLRTPGGVQTEFGMRRGRNKPVISGSFTLPYQDDSWMDARDASDNRAIFFTNGNQVGSMWMISAPTVQITDVQRVDWNGIAAQQVSWKGRHDADTSGADELARSAFRLHNF